MEAPSLASVNSPRQSNVTVGQGRVEISESCELLRGVWHYRPVSLLPLPAPENTTVEDWHGALQAELAMQEEILDPNFLPCYGLALASDARHTDGDSRCLSCLVFDSCSSSLVAEMRTRTLADSEQAVALRFLLGCVSELREDGLCPVSPGACASQSGMVFGDSGLVQLFWSPITICQACKKLKSQANGAANGQESSLKTCYCDCESDSGDEAQIWDYIALNMLTQLCKLQIEDEDSVFRNFAELFRQGQGLDDVCVEAEKACESLGELRLCPATTEAAIANMLNVACQASMEDVDVDMLVVLRELVGEPVGQTEVDASQDKVELTGTNKEDAATAEGNGITTVASHTDDELATEAESNEQRLAVCHTLQWLSQSSVTTGAEGEPTPQPDSTEDEIADGALLPGDGLDQVRKIDTISEEEVVSEEDEDANGDSFQAEGSHLSENDVMHSQQKHAEPADDGTLGSEHTAGAVDEEQTGHGEIEAKVCGTQLDAQSGFEGATTMQPLPGSQSKDFSNEPAELTKVQGDEGALDGTDARETVLGGGNMSDEAEVVEKDPRPASANTVAELKKSDITSENGIKDIGVGLELPRTVGKAQCNDDVNMEGEQSQSVEAVHLAADGQTSHTEGNSQSVDDESFTGSDNTKDESCQDQEVSLSRRQEDSSRQEKKTDEERSEGCETDETSNFVTSPTSSKNSERLSDTPDASALSSEPNSSGFEAGSDRGKADDSGDSGLPQTDRPTQDSVSTVGPVVTHVRLERAEFLVAESENVSHDGCHFAQVT